MKRLLGWMGLFVFLCVALSPILLPAQDDSSSAKKASSEVESFDLRAKIDSWKRMSPFEREVFLKELNDSEITKMITFMGDDDKTQLFKSLAPKNKANIFLNLEKTDQELIYNRLSEAEKQLLLQKYPDLPSIVDIQKPTPRPIEKPTPPPKTEKAVPSPPSRIEKVMSGLFPTDIAKELNQYGYNFFKQDAITFAPILNVPVGSDYIIGPGDNFEIHLWGKTENAYDVTVNRDGVITLPRLGDVTVSGLTYAEMKDHLIHRFKQYYPEFKLSITMGQLRTFQIFVVGEAEQPGTYSVSSLSTLITALFATGGPNKNGSMRNIQLVRSSAIVKTIDLYDFFLKGDKKQDVRLEPGDTLFIPVIGPVVGIAGNVRRPGIYEMQGNQTIAEIIDLAGGVLPIGYLQNVVVERIEAHSRRIVRSFNLDPGTTPETDNLKSVLKDADLVKIYPVHQRMRNVIYLEGHVKYPREYEYKPGMHVSDLIPSYDSLLPEPYLPQAEIIRLVPPDLHPELFQFDLGKMLAGDADQNIELQDLDRVIVYDRWTKKEMPQVRIAGAVKSPGTFRLYEGMTIKDLIFKADNLTEKAFLEKGLLSRVVPGEKGTDTIKMTFSPQKAMAGLAPDNIVLQPDDIVHIREIPQYGQALMRKVYLEGEFLFPGEYSFSEGDLLSSVIERAGGLSDEAYPFGAVFQRESVKKVQKEQLKDYIDKLEEEIYTLGAQAASTAIDKEEAAILAQTLTSKKNLLEKMKTAQPTGRMVINLEELLANPASTNNFKLRAGDRLIINKKPDFVNVMGEVFNPTAVFAEKDKSIEHYLNLVGGTTDNAQEDQIYLVKASGAVISKSQEGFFGLISWDPKNYRWSLGGFESTTVDPGDTIIVPKKVEKYPWLKLAKDITQITFQIAVSAGVIVAAF